MSQKHLLITFNNKTITLKEIPKTYNELINKITTHFKNELPPVWALKYEDTDNDLISLVHSEDYEGLLSELRAAEEFVKVFVIVKEGQSLGSSMAKKEVNELEGSMAGSEDSYNVLDPEENMKKEGSSSDDDVIDVASLDASQNIKEIEPKIEEDEQKLIEMSSSEVSKESPGKMEVFQEEKAEVPMEVAVVERLVEKIEEKSVKENIVERKVESMEKIEDVPVQREERPQFEDMLMTSQHSIISQKDVPDYTKNYEFYVPQSTDSVKEAENAQNKDLSESTEIMFKKEQVEEAIREEPEEIIEKVEERMESESEVKREDKGMIIHEGVKCDGCGKDPLTGIRYKCSVCEDFDFCEGCEANMKHEHSVFLKIKTPKDAEELRVNRGSMNIFEEIDEYLYGLENQVKEKVKNVVGFIKRKLSSHDESNNRLMEEALMKDN